MSTATANIADLKNAPIPREARLPAVSPGFGDLQSFELLQRTGKLLSASPLVPDMYRGAEGVASCVIALDMALRLKASVLMVMQNLDIIHGRPSWRAQFLIATFNQCGRFSPIRYAWQGEPNTDTWGCRATAIDLQSGEKLSGPLVTIALAKAEGWHARSGSKWKTIPELMLTYRSAAWFIRTTAPELSMGLPTSDEMEDRPYIDGEVLNVERIRNGEHAQPRDVTPAPIKGEVTSETTTADLHDPATDTKPLFTKADVLAKIEAIQTGADVELCRDLARGILDPDEAEAMIEKRLKALAAQAVKK